MSDAMSALEKVKKLQKELGNSIVERDTEIEGALVALIAGAHVLFLGPPGTAKSLLANYVCKSIQGGQFFSWLLTKFSNPEELFGPPSLKGLKEDKYRRITTNKLPEAHIAFLDEVFKANSAILNALLTVINERKFHNDGQPMDVPLLTCFGASNELPQSDELNALFDRFILRYWITEIKDEGNFKALLQGALGETAPLTQLSLDEIKALQKELDNVKVPDEVLGSIMNIQQTLKLQKGITASDRRWKMSVKILRAMALLRGRHEVTNDDLEILSDVLWTSPDQRRVIMEVISPLANPLNLKAMEYLDAAKEQFEKFMKDKESLEVASQTNGMFKEILKKINNDIKDRPENKLEKINKTRAEIVKMQEAVIKQTMG